MSDDDPSAYSPTSQSASDIQPNNTLDASDPSAFRPSVKLNTQTGGAGVGALGSDWDNFFAGMGRGTVALGRGAKQLLDVPAVWLEQKLGGGDQQTLSSLITGKTKPNPDNLINKVGSALGMPTAAESAAQTQKEVDESSEEDKPLLNTKAGMVGNVVGQAATLMGAGILAEGSYASNLLTRSMVNPLTPKQAIVSGAIQGALDPTLTDESHVWNAAEGSASSVVGNKIVNGITRIAQPFKNVLSAALNKSVNTLENYGISLDAAQKTGATFLKNIRSSFSDNPLTAGTQAEFNANQGSQFTKAILSTIGENASAATSDVMQAADKRIGDVFKDILDRNQVWITNPVLQRLADARREALVQNQTPVVDAIDRILAARGAGGQQDAIPGQIAYGIKKDLDRFAASADSTLKYHALVARSTLMDATHQSLSPADAQAFGQARLQFANMKKIESSIDKNGEGQISPAKLAGIMGQKRNIPTSVYGYGNQELKDLAYAGNALLTDKTPNSGTAKRLMLQAQIPLLAGAVTGLYEGSNKDSGVGFDVKAAGLAATGTATVGRMAMQKAINSHASSEYLSRGLKSVPLRNLLTSPNTNRIVGGSLRQGATQSIAAPLLSKALPLKESD